MPVIGRPRPRFRIAPLLALTLVLAACGGDADGPATTAAGPASTTGTATTPATTGTAPATTTAAARTPKERLAAIAAALHDVQSYHVEGTVTDEDGESVLEGDVTATGTADFRLTLKGTTVRFRIIGTAAYVRASASYWRETGGAGGEQLARQLGGAWVTVPAGEIGVGEVLDELSPRTLAACIAVGNGTISDGGTARVGGQDADVLVDAGDEPGTSPGRLYTAQDGPPLPLRVVATGKRRPGGTIDPKCQDEDDTSTRSDIAFSRFDEPIQITPPKDAIQIPGGDAGSSTPAPT